MGRNNSREYRVWDAAEEAALKTGVKKHGLGAWERIRTDPEFNILLHRTGVQLKDKWRNLVKFRHFTPDETLELQPKTSGPWHRKYTATAAAAQRLAAGAAAAETAAADGAPAGSGTAAAAATATAGSGRAARSKQQQQQADTDEDADLPLDDDEQPLPKRKSSRSVKRRTFEDLEAEQDDDDSWEIGCDSESRGVGGRKRRRYNPGLDGEPGPAEDRRFGIYDRRRYGSGPGRGRPRQQYKPADAPNAGTRSGSQQRSRESGSASEQATEGEDSYVVQCPCGITQDDGNLMIECERCNAWAHTACLQAQMEQDPQTHCYDFMHYVCQKCQLQDQQQQHHPIGRKTRSKQKRSLSTETGQQQTSSAAAAAAAAATGQQQATGLSELLHLLRDHNVAGAAAAGDLKQQQQQPATAGLTGLAAGLISQGSGRLTPNLGRLTPPNAAGLLTHPLLQHSWLVQEAAAAAGSSGFLAAAHGEFNAAAAANAAEDGSRAAAGLVQSPGNGHSVLNSLHGMIGSSGALAAAAELANLAAGGSSSSSRNAGSLSISAPTLTAERHAPAAAAAAAGPAVTQPGNPWEGLSSLLSQQQPSAAAAAADLVNPVTNPNPIPDPASQPGMVDIDPVLLLYLQGSLQVHKRQRGPAVGRKPKEDAADWGRGFVDWATMQKQRSGSDLAGQVGPAAAVASTAAAAAGLHGRHHPAAVLPGHPKCPQQQQQGGGSAAAAGGSSEDIIADQPQQQQQHEKDANARQGPDRNGNSGIIRTVARKHNGLTANGGAYSPDLQRQQQQHEEGQPLGLAAARSNSSSSKFASTMMGRALEQHQPELEGLLKAGSDPTAAAAAAAGSSKPLATAAVGSPRLQEQQYRIKQDPDQTQQQLGLTHELQQQLTSLMQRHAAAGAADAANATDLHQSESQSIPPAAFSPAPLVHAVSAADHLRPDSLGTGLLGQLGLGGMYPALLGTGPTAGTPPLPAVDRPPSRPLSAAALTAAAAAALRPPSRAASRQAAAAADALNPFSGLDPVLAAALHVHDARPPTPYGGFADYAALFRTATPDAFGGSSHLAAALSDLHHNAGNWLLSRTPDILQGIGMTGSSAAAAAPVLASGAVGTVSSPAVAGSSIQRPRSADPSAIVAAAAAAVAMGMANGVAAAAAGCSAAADTGSSFFNIDELILAPHGDSTAAAAAAQAPAASAAPAAVKSEPLTAAHGSPAAAAAAMKVDQQRPVFGCGLDLLAGAVAAATDNDK